MPAGGPWRTFLRSNVMTLRLSAFVGGILVLILSVSCGGSGEKGAGASSAADKPAPAPAGPKDAGAAPDALSWSGKVTRADLDLILKAGIPLFLRRVPIEAHKPKGKYVGFRIVSIDGKPEVKGLQVRAGDVVTSVNGMSIERPEYLMRIWQELGVASEIRIEFLRDGKPMIERIEIVEK